MGISERDGNWRVEDTRELATWFNWYGVEPNDYKGILEDCASLFYRGPNNELWTWTDINCELLRSVICEINA